MGAFRYEAMDGAGIRFNGSLEAATSAELADHLAAQGFTLLRANERRASRSTKGGRIRRRDLIDFTQNLSMLEASGVSLFDGLHDLSDQLAKTPMGPIVREIRADIGRGRPLSESFARFPHVFPPIYVQIVRAGESSGALGEVLRRLSDYLEWRESVRGLVKQMLVYPTVLGTAILGLVIFLITFLIPRLTEVYASAGVVLPPPTRALIFLSNILTTKGHILAAGLAAAVAAFVIFKRSEKGALLLATAMLHIPKVGPVIRKLSAAQFASTLSTLYKAGVDLQRGLETTAGVIENKAMAAAVTKASRRVLAGMPLAEAIRQTNAFQPLVTRMIAIGEKTGRLDEAFARVLAFYDREVPAAVKKFLAIVEPLLTVCAGFVVGFVVLSAMLPIFKLFEAIKR